MDFMDFIKMLWHVYILVGMGFAIWFMSVIIKRLDEILSVLKKRKA